jgi:hypothetical protein
MQSVDNISYTPSFHARYALAKTKKNWGAHHLVLGHLREQFPEVPMLGFPFIGGWKEVFTGKDALKLEALRHSNNFVGRFIFLGDCAEMQTVRQLIEQISPKAKILDVKKVLAAMIEGRFNYLTGEIAKSRNTPEETLAHVQSFLNSQCLQHLGVTRCVKAFKEFGLPCVI